MKLALGTVQFGLNYGIANRGGQITRENSSIILSRAAHAGIDTIDTAVTYGNSEEILGQIGISKWRVISKLPPLPSTVSNVHDWVFRQVAGCLDRLRIPSLNAILLHRPVDLLGAQGDAYITALQRIRSNGLAQAIGFSIYSPTELDSLCAAFRPDIVQSPFSIIDRRLANSGWLRRLAYQGIRVHTRSTFLQGLLFMPESLRPPGFARWAPLLNRWLQYCADLHQDPLTVSLGFALQHEEIERVVVGVDSPAQLEEILNAERMAGRIDLQYPAIESEDLELIEPFRWKST